MKIKRSNAGILFIVGACILVAGPAHAGGLKFWARAAKPPTQRQIQKQKQRAFKHAFKGWERSNRQVKALYKQSKTKHHTGRKLAGAIGWTSFSVLGTAAPLVPIGTGVYIMRTAATAGSVMIGGITAMAGSFTIQPVVLGMIPAYKQTSRSIARYRSARFSAQSETIQNARTSGVQIPKDLQQAFDALSLPQ